MVKKLQPQGLTPICLEKKKAKIKSNRKTLVR